MKQFILWMLLVSISGFFFTLLSQNWGAYITGCAFAALGWWARGSLGSSEN